MTESSTAPKTMPRTRRAVLGAVAATGASLGALATARGQSPASPAAPVSDEDAVYGLGLDAFTYGYPLIYFAKLRWQLMMVGDVATHEKSRWGAWLHRNAVITPASLASPQTDTLYATLLLDLTREPYMMRVPKITDRYWSVQMSDLFGRTFGLPNRRNYREDQWVAIVGPDWQGPLPRETRDVFRAPVRQAFCVMRMYFDASDADRAKAFALQKEFTLKPLSAFTQRREWFGDVAEVFAPISAATDPLAEFKMLQRMWQECPPSREDAAITAPFARIGLAPGVTDGFAGLSAAAQRGLARAEADARQRVLATANQFPGRPTANGWIAMRSSLGIYDDEDYLYRAAVAQWGAVALPFSENIYMRLPLEPGMQTPLNGDQRYTMRIGPAQFPRVGAFWSIHAYGLDTRVIANPINRYGVGDRTKFQRDADGGVTFHVQADDPGGALVDNWLPVQKGRPFVLMTREYEPAAGPGAMRWVGPEVRRTT